MQIILVQDTSIWILIAIFTIVCMFLGFQNANEPEHDKTNKMTCGPSEDSDQPGHLPSLVRLCCLLEESLDPVLPIKHTVNTDQAGQMPRLI